MKYSEWNDTGFPLAYLITFRCYGTWLHGDERGSVDEFNNKFDTPFLPQNEKWHEFNKELLKYEPVALNSGMRKSVELAIRETCDIRGWSIYAINVRTNHAHTVVSVGTVSSKKVLSALKANATRKMREDGLWQLEHSPWAEKGSRRFLWNEKSVEIAVDYVINGQGKPLPDFNQYSER
jgi:REP element-mobilizing transposase RayT